MSDKVIRHYSRPYGDCRADKRLYFGGSWPWQQGAECEIVVPEVGPYFIQHPSDNPGTYYMWVQTGETTRELLDSWIVPDQNTPYIHEVTTTFALSAITSLQGVSRTLLFSKVALSTYTTEQPLISHAVYGFVGSHSSSSPDGFPADPAFPDGYNGSDIFGAFIINNYTTSSGTIEIAEYFNS